MTLALFDVDGTLIRGLSSEQRFFLYLLTKGHLGPRQVLSWISFALRHLPRYGFHVGKKNKAYLTGLSEDKIRSLADDFVRNGLARALIPESAARLRAHLRAGDRVFLLTGTPDFIAEPLAAGVGAHGFRAARCVVAHGKFLSAPPSEHPYGADKLRIAHELCAEHCCALHEVTAYADSRTDLELLSKVGKAVVVNADRQLRAIALAQGWETM